ncbi:hypothetical protein DMB42_27815 [Nonomuraea sp. WAC 01424]|uniref:WD40 repeat domain-containing protein n=1 Tax=Nonomuraea sp. WAC 01424 TaxID=2203200 RepID=UPI000F7AD56E|nr:WD40 repeat domain-containing protein [Nonomuraea sp. WAC 01424]RSN05744.1 hypothetical protein DMB42_27815 [Nonomuraea sp. WAC 01424]
MTSTSRWLPPVAAGALSVAAAAGGLALALRGAVPLALITALSALLTGVTAGALILARRRGGPHVPLAAVADRLALLTAAEPDTSRPSPARPGAPPLPSTAPLPGVPSLPVRLGVRPLDSAAGRTVADLGVIFAESAPGPLVLLGPPGSGKTFAAARLCRHLAAAVAPGGPVPVLIEAGSWDPAAQPLPDWIALQLATRFAGFADGAADGLLGTARSLVGEGFVLPILDGFASGTPDLAALTAALPERTRLVLTCRTGDHPPPWDPPDDATVLHLQPLGLGEVTEHLRSSAGNANSQRRWRPVFERLAAAPDGPAATALTSPFTLSLARTRYNPPPGTPYDAALPHPEELLDAGRFPDRAAVESHLLEAYVPAAYRSAGETDKERIARDNRALVALARELDRRGSLDLAWWELRLAVGNPRKYDRWIVGVLTTLAVLPFEPPGTALLVGVIGFVSFALSSRALPDTLLDGRPRRLALRPPDRASFLRNVWLAISSGVLVGVGVALFRGWETGLVAGAAMGFANWWVGPLRAVLGFDDAADVRAVTPRRAVAQDRWLTLAQTSEATVTGALVGYAMQVVPGHGIPLGVCIGAVALLRGAWGRFVMARLWWRFRQATPLRMLAFLERAERNQVLVRSGAVYRFRHAAIQHHLAGARTPAPAPPAPAPAPAPTVATEPPAGRPAHRPLAQLRGGITKLATTPDRRFLVTGGTGVAVLVWDLDDLNGPAVVAVTHSRWNTSPPPLRSFAIQAGGDLLATGGIDGTIGLHAFGTPADPRPIAALRAHREDVAGLDFHPSEPLLAAAGGDHAVTLWDVTDPAAARLVTTLRSHGRPVRSVRFSPDGSWLLTGGRDGVAHLWDLREPGEPRLRHRLPGDVGWIFVTALDPGGGRLAIAGRWARLTLWDLPDAGPPVRRARVPLYGYTAAFDADGSLLAAGHRRGVGLWRPAGVPELVTHLPGAFPVTAVAFHPARRAVIGGGLDGSLALWTLDHVAPGIPTGSTT